MTTFYKIYQHFYCYVYINPFPNLLEILNLTFCQTEESQACVFLHIFESSV